MTAIRSSKASRTLPFGTSLAVGVPRPRRPDPQFSLNAPVGQSPRLSADQRRSHRWRGPSRKR